jgi:hypothetical protein
MHSNIIQFGPARGQSAGSAPRPAGDYSVPPIPAADLQAIFSTRRSIEARLQGKPRHVTIHPDVPWTHVLIMFAVAGFIGVLLAVGGF